MVVSTLESALDKYHCDYYLQPICMYFVSIIVVDRVMSSCAAAYLFSIDVGLLFCPSTIVTGPRCCRLVALPLESHRRHFRNVSVGPVESVTWCWRECLCATASRSCRRPQSSTGIFRQRTSST